MRHLSAFAAVAVLTTACTRTPEPVPPVVPDPYAVLPPVDVERGSKITMDRMVELLTVRQKVGQLVMPWLLGDYAAYDSDEYDTLAVWIDSLEVGGIIISIGPPLEVATKLNTLQRASRLPLLIAADLEYGSGMRLRGGTAFPPPMAIAAGGRVTDAYELGRITAEEARAVGIHMTFSPVADLNSNPENPIVNTRAFGEDPELAAPFLRAYVAGASDYDLFTTAKHFPGHGDTDVDSHVELPVVRACWDRLDSLELEPFRVAIRAGVTAVMTAHVAVPCITDDRPEAATLSTRVMTELLRDSLGFEGLVVTDALDMGAIVREFGPGESAVRAFLAGSDLLLMPADPRAAIEAMVAAVDSGRIPLERLDRSVRRMLALKERAGLFDRRTVALDSVPAVVGRREYTAFAEDVARRAMTLVQEGTIRSFRERRGRTGVVVFARETNLSAGGNLVRDLRLLGDTVTTFRLYPASGSASYDSVRVLVDSNPRVIFAVNVPVVSGLGHVAMPDSLAALIEASARRKPTLLVSFGNPYLLAQLPEFTDGYLLAWSGVPAAERAVARALAAGAPVSGRLPITLSKRYPRTWGVPLPRLAPDLATVPDSTLTPVRDPAFDYARLDSVRLYLERQVAAGAFPGAVLVVGHDGAIAFVTAVGRYGDDDLRPVSDTTVYDLASLTKVVGLTSAAMLLASEGRLELERPVVDYLPEFAGPGREDVLVRHLLTHTSGLPAWVPLYQETDTPEAAIARVFRAPLEAPAGDRYVYSDLGAITLTQIVERVSGMPIDRLLEERVFDPLGMARTRYRPPPEWTSFIAPTERDPWRGRLIRGEVHDENAYRLGGVSGHAGLFSTGWDLARFAIWMLDAWHGRLRETDPVYLPEDVVRLFTRRQPGPEGSTRALGWDTPSDSGRSSAGSLLSRESFGHTGFTGTSLWIEPERELFIILLTNRVHPSRENRAILDVRPTVADMVVESLR
jgi:beta-glucosidase-like glycosyl hydrolase/CubicO group peptidase (beta-lactamase class C family)